MSTLRVQRKRDDEYRHGDLRRALTVAARRMLEEGGPEAVSLRELARAVNVSHSAPYRHFRDRASLFAAVARAGFAELADALRKIDTGLPAGERLTEMGVAYVTFAVANPQTFKLMFGARREREAQSDEERLSFALLTEQVDRTVKIERAKAHVVASWAVVHGLAHLLLDKRIPYPAGGKAALAAFARDVIASRS
jgi:AcrR family transcriptional regulator